MVFPAAAPDVPFGIAGRAVRRTQISDGADT
jgi:hypothetical protein